MSQSDAAAVAREPLPHCPAFPLRRDDPLAPPARCAWAREAEPICRVTLWNGAHAWLVTRHEHRRAIPADDARFSGRFAQQGFPTVTEARIELRIVLEAILRRHRRIDDDSLERHEHGDPR